MVRSKITLFASLLAFASCAVTADEPGLDEAPDESTISSELIQSCYDWSGTCTGLPEGAACGNDGTCVADTYGVYGWCTCWEAPPSGGYTCPSGNSCGGLSEGSSCQRWNGTWGTCNAYSAGPSNVPTGCMCL